MIHDTKELRLRARGHHRADRICQGRYGDMEDRSFRGCAIGCLGTPHRRDALRAFINKHFTFNSQWQDYSGELGAGEQRQALQREFGIRLPLAHACEAFFEAQETNAAASNFLLHFAEALNEGAEIRRRDLDRFFKDNFGCRMPTRWRGIEELVEQNPRPITAKFIAWIKDQKPSPAALGTGEVAA